MKAMDGHSPVLNNVTLGTWLEAGSSDQLPFDTVGNSDLRLRLDGFQVEDGVVVYGSRYVDIRNNVIQLEGDLIERIEDSGLAVFNGQHVKFLRNEVFHSGVGITAMTTDFVMRKNEVHHCSHDGFKIYGGEDWLVEGNVIHDLDDGLTDAQPGGMHVDGMHLHMIIHEGGYYHPRWAGGAYNFTFRGNFIYHTEAMGVMINECDSGVGRYENFVWENNIFGPTGGILFILGAAFYNGFVFRHNTVLYTPGDQWTSMWGREMGAEFGYPSSMSYYVQVWGNPEGYEFYNNVFTSATDLTQDEGFVGSNTYYSGDDVNLGDPGWETAAPIHAEIPGLLQDFMDTGAQPGEPLPGSVAVDNGTTSQGTIGEDFLGNPRDSSPDIGAIELQ